MARTTTRLFHESVREQFEVEHRLFEQILRVLFGLGGVLWLLVFALPFDSPEHHSLFRVHQYQLYVALLSLWGLQARRDSGRMTLLLEKASLADTSLAMVRWTDLNGPNDHARFAVFRMRGSMRSLFVVALTWILFISVFWILFKQLLLIFS